MIKHFYFKQVYRSEWILDTASPDWKPVTLDCAKLCLGDWNRDLRYFQFVCCWYAWYTWYTCILVNMNTFTHWRLEQRSQVVMNEKSKWVCRLIWRMVGYV